MSAPTYAKMVVEAYGDSGYGKKTGEYPVLFNPETYAVDWDFRFSEFETVGHETTTPELREIRGSEMSMTFVIDGTGVGAAILGKSRIVVLDEVDKFLSVATVVNPGGTRKTKPPYCRLVWARLNLKCLVTRVRLEITLMDRDGTPLRAKMHVTFHSLHGKGKG